MLRPKLTNEERSMSQMTLAMQIWMESELNVMQMNQTETVEAIPVATTPEEAIPVATPLHKFRAT